MEEKNNFIEGEKVENNRKDFKTVRQISYNEKNGNFSFGKHVFIPFVSGVVGAGVVLGTCFGVPTVKEKLSDFLNSNKNTSVLLDNNGVNSIL